MSTRAPLQLLPRGGRWRAKRDGGVSPADQGRYPSTSLRLVPLPLQGRSFSSCAALALLAGCNPGVALNREPGPFPAPDRPVSRIVLSRWSNEEERDRLREAETVMDKAGIAPGMTVADIGAGEGYYTIRLAQRVGPRGRVLAEDIFPAVRDTLAERVARERLQSVSVRLGAPADPKLPDASFDRVFMVHMYHEIAQPYEFLWRMRPALKSGGLVIVVDANRSTDKHGTPPALLACEFRAVGYELAFTDEMPSAGGYLAAFRAKGGRPEPASIKPCRLG